MRHFCTNCGKLLVNTWKICAYCGVKIRKDLWYEQPEQAQEKMKILNKEEISTNISTINTTENNKIREKLPFLEIPQEKEGTAVEEINKFESISSIEREKVEISHYMEQSTLEKDFEKPLDESIANEDIVITKKSLERLEPRKNLCPFCGYENELDKNYCYQCGYLLRVKLKEKNRREMKKFSKLSQNNQHLIKSKATTK